MKHIWWGLVIICCCYLLGCAGPKVLYQGEDFDVDPDAELNARIEECYKNHPDSCMCAVDSLETL